MRRGAATSHEAASSGTMSLAGCLHERAGGGVAIDIAGLGRRGDNVDLGMLGLDQFAVQKRARALADLERVGAVIGISDQLRPGDLSAADLDFDLKDAPLELLHVAEIVAVYEMWGSADAGRRRAGDEGKWGLRRRGQIHAELRHRGERG